MYTAGTNETRRHRCHHRRHADTAVATAPGPAAAAARADLGAFRLPNRVVMAPVTRARAADDGLVPTAMHAAYYGQRAGAGLIIAEGTWVGEQAIGFVNVPGVYTGEQVAAWRRVTDVVHALGGRIVLQLWHTGAASHPDHLGGTAARGTVGDQPRTRSFTSGGFKETVTPRAMTLADIDEHDRGLSAPPRRTPGGPDSTGSRSVPSPRP